MDLVICCFDCYEEYIVEVGNTSVDGPLIKTTCPKCNTTIERNLSKFLSIQVEYLFPTMFQQLGYMFNFVKILEDKVNFRELGEYHE